MVKRIKNPLRKRYLRELLGDPGKYLVIFLLIAATIAIVSGCVVAQESMAIAYADSFEKYQIEDGFFVTENRMNKAQKQRVENLGIRIYDNFYADRPLANGNTVRIFKVREDVDRICVMEGQMPQAADEIGLDRMYADNNGLRVGDEIEVDGMPLRISSLVALSDYSALFEDNNDTMFDALEFGVAVVPEAGFNFSDGQLTWKYAWIYQDRPESDIEKSERGEDLLKALQREVSLEDYVPEYQNQAIHFTGDDISGDQVMMEVLLYIVIVIMAFVFAVTISNTITKEASVIGTLRAMGFTKGELIRHYMLLPFLVTLVSGVVGNVLGYTVLKDFAADLYYNSYSLPTYETVWNAGAFVKTTIIPVLLMTDINYVMIRQKLQLTPLQFLRRNLKRRRTRGALRLYKGIPFFTRFRLRVILQNLGNYFVLFVGIFFANFLLFFGLLFVTVLQDYEQRIPDMMFCNYQYILSIPTGALDEEHKLESMMQLLQFFADVETDNPDAEKFSAYELETLQTEGYLQEDVTLYGIQENSRYLDLRLQPDDVYISDVYADKYELSVGDTITLQKPYADEQYSFVITGIYPYEASIAIFMPQKDLNALFDLGEDTFSGYFSDTEITDIAEKNISSVIDRQALSKLTRQLQHSMGGMMNIVYVFAVGMFVILVYLLSKIIIEKNAQSIAMTKILGYQGREISALYILPTTILVIAFILASFPLVNQIMESVFRLMMKAMLPGWIFYEVNPSIWIRMLALGVGTYALVALLEYIKIQRIPKDETLKNAE